MEITTNVTPAPIQPIVDTTVYHPFGLPLGTVRGMFSLVICTFFWIALLWPGEHHMKVVLAHFFLLGMVLMAFASHPSVNDRETAPFLPWLFRTLFVGISGIVVAYAWYKDVAVLQQRLTPDLNEVKDWWIPFLGATGIGFGLGLLVRFVLGRNNHIFQTLRAWLSVVGMLMLVVEIVIFLSVTGPESTTVDFIHYWQCVELAIVSAYFGTRA